MDNIKISYPTYFLIIIIIAALAYALSLYFREKRMKENHRWLPSILGILRFISILGILFLLLTPLFKNFLTETQKPIIVIASDRSASVESSTDKNLLDSLHNSTQSIITNLSDQFDFVSIDFAENLVFSSNDSIRQESSNISAPLEYISESYENQNLGAVILLTDGIYNEGKSPLYADLKMTAPLYSVPLGDTTIRKDLLIKNAIHNRIVYLNDKFLIEVDVQAYNSNGAKSNLNLYKVEDRQSVKLQSEGINIEGNNFFNSYQFELEANTVGNNKYFVSLSRINNEISYQNNTRNIYLEVLDARQKILLIADAPHPDIKALKYIIEKNRNYELKILKVDEPISNFNSYDLVILHNLPSKKNPISNTIARINKRKKPVFYIAGATIDIPNFSQVQDVIDVEGSSANLNNVTPVIKQDFTLFTTSDLLNNEIGNFVPLKTAFGDYKISSTAQTMLYQKIGNIETTYPLLAFSDINNHKQSVLCGEGIWRWRLIEYAENDQQDISDELIMKSLQYISQKEDKRKFRAFSNKNVYKENDNIVLDAQLYNASYEAINNPEAHLTITDENSKKYEYTFSKSNDFYLLNAGRFTEGNYSFLASTSYNGETLTASGKFNIQSIIKEQYDLTAKHDLLYNLSQKFGGELVYPDKINDLESILSENDNIKPILYQKAQTESLLNLKWLLGLFILLLGVEWFLRRYFGSY